MPILVIAKKFCLDLTISKKQEKLKNIFFFDLEKNFSRKTRFFIKIQTVGDKQFW